MNENDLYDAGFYSSMKRQVKASSRVIVPILYEAVRPKSVVDVGCGEGEWLAEFCEYGVDEILGIDGAWVKPERLEIPPDRFMAHDLRSPLPLDRRFDLTLSLECGEHLPEDAADNYVDTLVRLAPVVAFSAAIPGQGGRDHINEQWPEYWRSKFFTRNYHAVDIIRPRIWKNRDVAWYYAQNLILYVDAALIHKLFPQVQIRDSENHMLAVVHPAHYAGLLWISRVQDQLIDMATLLPEQSRVIFVDGTTHRIYRSYKKMKVIPFGDPDNFYSGWPPDDDAALKLLRGLQRDGAQFIAFPSHTRWLLDHYRGLESYLERTARLVADEPDLKIYAF